MLFPKAQKQILRSQSQNQKSILKQAWQVLICMVLLLSFYSFKTTVVANTASVDQVSLHLKWMHGFQFAGYYAALEKGYYEEEGLDVILKEASTESKSINAVLVGESDYGVCSSDILNVRLSGEPVVVLSVIFQHSPYVIISKRDAGILEPSDLIGKRVMVDNEMESALFGAMLSHEGLSAEGITLLPHSWNINDIINGNADAATAYITDQPNQLRLKGEDPVFLNPMDYGIDFYGDCLFTSEKEIQRHPKRAEAFRRASLKGWEYAMSHVDEMVDLILQLPGVDERGITAGHLQLEAEQMQKLILPKFVEIGHSNMGRWKHIADSYVELGLLDANYSLDGFIYDPDSQPNNRWIYILLIVLTALNIFALFAWFGRRQIHKYINRRTKDIRENEAKLIQAQEIAGIVKWEMDILEDCLYDLTDFFEFYKLENKHDSISTDDFLKLVHPDDRDKLKIAFKSAIENKTIYEVEHRLVFENNKVEWVREYGKCEYDNNGNPIHAFGTTQNITKQKEAEAELKKALEKATESDRIKSTFLATMSHELRTPLNPIIGFSELIDEDMPKEDIVKYNKIINASGNHLLGIVEDLFDITLIESGAVKILKKDINLHLALHNILDIIRLEQRELNKSGVEIRMSIPDNKAISHVCTDLSKFKQILLNLLKNALKFTHKGHIVFGYDEVEKDGKELLEFYVEDTGIGIAEDKRDIIFNLFSQAQDSNTREYGGTGIGLSICEKLSKLLGGEIWLESELGKGSTFFFTIPKRRDSKEDIPEVKKKAKKINLKDKLVLIVEDDELSYEYLRIVLLKVGVKIISAINGKEAIEICKENSDVRLVLMDVNMPEMNGYDATREIKKLIPDLPIIIQTAYAISGDEEKSLAAGANDYISKPISREKLIEMVYKYLEKELMY